TEAAPLMGSEDFAFMLEARPGCYAFIGNGIGSKGGCMVHNPGYDFNDDILAIGADGRPRAFGSRRHYDFSSPTYLEASRQICTAVAERYGRHPAVR
ncbi:beta-galactosidase, partial [Enterobacter sp. DRP3]|nr:beta-galactosidase [Enterobacter sp. DRP3]